MGFEPGVFSGRPCDLPGCAASADPSIRRPLPDHVSVEPLPDAEEACPACEAKRWELASVTARDADGAEPVFSYEWGPGKRAAVCGACGYVHALPGETQHIVVKSARLDPDEQRKRWEALTRTVWNNATAGLGRAPIGLARRWRGARRIASWGADADESAPIRDITLHHGESYQAGGPWLSVTTSTEQIDEDLLPVDQWLEENLVGAVSDRWRDPDASDDASSDLREQLRRRETQQWVRALERRRISLRVNDEPVSFIMIGDEEAWCGHGEYHGTAITIVAREFPAAHVALESADVGLYLAH